MPEQVRTFWSVYLAKKKVRAVHKSKKATSTSTLKVKKMTLNCSFLMGYNRLKVLFSRNNIENKHLEKISVGLFCACMLQTVYSHLFDSHQRRCKSGVGICLNTRLWKKHSIEMCRSIDCHDLCTSLAWKFQCKTRLKQLLNTQGCLFLKNKSRLSPVIQFFNPYLDFWKSRSWEIKVCFKP